MDADIVRTFDDVMGFGENVRKSWIGLAAVVVLTACGGGDDQPSDLGAGPDETTTTTAMAADHDMHAGGDCSPSGTSLAIVAKDASFDKDCLAAPANQDFDVTLDNQDAGPHNLVLLESHTATDVFARVEIFTGPEQATMEVSKLPAGTYAFHCEVHPEKMSGTFVVE